MVEAVVEAAVAAAVAGPAQSVLCCSVLSPVSVSLCLALPASPVRRLLSLLPCARPTASLYHRTLILLSLFLPSRSSNSASPFLPLPLSPTHRAFARSLSLFVARLLSFSATIVSSLSLSHSVPWLLVSLFVRHPQPTSHTHCPPLSPSFSPSFFFFLPASLILLIPFSSFFFYGCPRTARGQG